MSAKVSFLIHNAQLITVSGEILHNSSLLVEDGLIKEIGQKVRVENCEVIDAKGAWLAPGFIDPMTRLGLHESWRGVMGSDENETPQNIAPWLRALDGICSDDEAFTDALEGGVTTVMVCPGNATLLSGQGTIIKTAGSRVIDERVVKDGAALVGSLYSTTRSAAAEASMSRQRADRSQGMALFLAELRKAKEFIEKRDKALASGKEASQADFRLQPIVDLLDGKIPLILQAIYATDILNALELAEEWGFTCILERVTEGHLIPDELHRAKQPLIIGPILVNRRYATRPTTHRAPGLLSKAGLKFALTSGHPAVAINNLNVQAAIACREGLSESEALKSITLYPAQLLGLDDRLGTLEVGKEADLVLWSDHPFETEARVQKVWIKGQVCYAKEVKVDD